jgi:hypothetical protein
MWFLSSAKPSSSTNLARAPKRIGDGVSYEFVGETQETIGEVRYAVRPAGRCPVDRQEVLREAARRHDRLTS